MAATNGAADPGAASPPSRERRPDGLGRVGGLRLRSIERPERRARAGQADRPAEQPAQRPPERDEPGTTSAAAGSRSLADGEDAGPGDEVGGGQPGPQLLGEVGRRQPDAPRRQRPGARRRRRRRRGVETAQDGRDEQRRRARRGGRGAARPARRDPRRGPGRRRGRTARPSRAGRPRHAARSASSSAPQASSAPSIVAAASDEPPARPGRDRDPLLEPRGEGGRGARAARPAATDGRAGRGDRAEHEVVGRRAGVEARRRGACPRGRRPARGSAGRRGRAARTPSGGRGSRRRRRPTTARVRLSLAGARRTTGCRRRSGSASSTGDPPAAPVRADRSERLAQRQPLPDRERLRPAVRVDAGGREGGGDPPGVERAAGGPGRCGASCAARGRRPGRAATARPRSRGRAGRRRRRAPRR